MKKSAFTLQPARRRPRGSALIVCLSLVVIMTILLVGFVNTSRNERITASVHVAGQKANIFADMAINQARATLLAAADKNGASTEPPLATGPGRLVKLPTAASDDPKIFDLTSGADGSNAAVADVTVAINAPGLLSAKGALVPNSTSTFPVRWIYVRQNGELESDGNIPAYSETNPLIGRYAYYTDDESARVNLNTAWTRDSVNTTGEGHPSKIDLRGAIITDSDPAAALAEANTLQTGRQNSPFATALSALTGGDVPLLNATMKENPSSFTHYNHSPLTDIFGKPRRVLTTKASVANGAPFFDILKSQTADPGDYKAIDTGKAAAVINEIYADLSRTDWPMLPGKSFVDKYGPLATAQIALDMVEYIRSCESNLPIVEPIRGTFDVATGKFTVDIGAATSSSLVGNSRRLLITEIAAEFPANPVVVQEEGQPAKKEYHIKFWIELYYPMPHAGVGGNMPGPINLSTTRLYIGKLFNVSGPASENQVTQGELQAMGSATTSLTMNPGDYRVIMRTFILPEPASFAQSGVPPEGRIRVAIGSQQTTNIRYNIAPISGPFADCIPYPIQPGKSLSEIQSVSSDDPRVNNTKGDWKLGPATMGSPNATSVGQASTASPEQDTQNNVITDVSAGPPRMQMPITTVGMLGFLHTGVIGPTPGAPGTPWRTLRLQPKNDAGKTMLPDWAMLDLFEAPQPSTTSATRPRPNTVGGRINPNTTFYPFTEDANLPVERPLPLQALLSNAMATTSGGSIITEARAATLAANIIQKKPATNGVDYSGVAPTHAAPFYAYPGELLEIEGIADGGEESEALAGEVLALTTTRSDVFRIYAVGQSVRQTSSGVINVVAEEKKMSLVERDGSKARVVQEQDWGL